MTRCAAPQPVLVVLNRRHGVGHRHLHRIPRCRPGPPTARPSHSSGAPAVSFFDPGTGAVTSLPGGRPAGRAGGLEPARRAARARCRRPLGPRASGAGGLRGARAIPGSGFDRAVERSRHLARRDPARHAPIQRRRAGDLAGRHRPRPGRPPSGRPARCSRSASPRRERSSASCTSAAGIPSLVLVSVAGDEQIPIPSGPAPGSFTTAGGRTLRAPARLPLPRHRRGRPGVRRERRRDQRADDHRLRSCERSRPRRSR